MKTIRQPSFSAHRESLSFRAVPVPAGFILALVSILVFAMAARTPLESDLWWHLRAGEEMWSQGRPLLQDTFSYTRLGQSWTNHSWLAEIILYLAHRLAGFLGLSAVIAALAAGSMALVYLQMDGPPLLRAFWLILPAVVAAPVWSPRPQMFSFALLAITGFLVYLEKWRRRSCLWLLPPLFVLWSNLHGGYILGLIWLAGTAAGEALNHILGYRGPHVLSWGKIGRLLLILALCSLVVVINPNGTAMWGIPFRTVGVGALQEYISEWSSPDFHQVSQQPLLWLFIAVLAAVGLSGRRLDGTDLVLVSGFGVMAFMARRNFGPFALAAAPVLARHAWPALQAWLVRSFNQVSTGDDRTTSSDQPALSPHQVTLQRVMNALLLAILSLAALVKLVAVTQADFVLAAERKLFPVDAAVYLRSQQLPGRLFNEYDWGGYLIWAASEIPVFIDGRTDLYDDEIISQWLLVERAQPGWQAVLDFWDIRLALIKPQSAIGKQLAEAGWEVIYQDAVAVIFKR